MVLEFEIYGNVVRIISPEQIQESPKFCSKFMVRMRENNSQTGLFHRNPRKMAIPLTNNLWPRV